MKDAYEAGEQHGRADERAKLQLDKMWFWLAEQGYISPIEADRTFDSLSNFKSVIEDITAKEKADTARSIFEELDNLPNVDEGGCDFSGLIVFNTEDYEKLKHKFGAK